MTARAVVLDASALIAYARNEPGAAVVAERLRTSDQVTVSSVNWAEVVGKLRQFGMTPTLLRQALSAADARVVAFEESDAGAAGDLVTALGGTALSLGDRACIALSIALHAPAVTADRAWNELVIDDLQVELIR